MKFYLPLIILLTALSPNLEAATLNTILTQPYEVVEPSLLRAEGLAAPLDWSGSLIDFQALVPQGLNNNTGGTFDLVINNNPIATQQFIGEILPTREFTLVTNVGGNLAVLDGVFTLDYDRALGRVFSLDSPQTTGFFEMQAVDLPTSFILLFSAAGVLMLTARRST